MKYYILDNHKPVPVDDMLAWMAWLAANDCKVAVTQIGDVTVSTVFFGLDYYDREDIVPMLFETAIFGGVLDGNVERATTWDEAAANHADFCGTVEELEREENPDAE